MSNWNQYQENSFYESSARERAIGLVDQGSFKELCGPELKMKSSHLSLIDESAEFDDGVVTGVGHIGKRPVFVISQEGAFIGGSVGEIHGAKIVKTLSLAEDLFNTYAEKYPDQIETIRPFVILSFDTGGVRLHEANAGLLAHAEIMDQLQRLRNKVPVISVIGGKVGGFGGMGFVAAATDIIIMSAKGRLGLTGPEVIEQEMGRAEFDSSDRALIYRTTGGKHKYIVGDCNFLVEDTIAAFRNQITDCFAMNMQDIENLRRIGSFDHTKRQMKIVKALGDLHMKDAKDAWTFAGNKDPEELIDMQTSEFLSKVSRLNLTK